MYTIRHILQIKGTDVWTISPDATVYDALRLMQNKDIGALLVTEGDKLVGIISERDYARKVVLQNKSSKDARVRDIMTRDPYTIHPDQTVSECMELMTNQRIRHVPVIEDDHLVGVVSIGDVVKDIIYQQRQIIKDLEGRIIGK